MILLPALLSVLLPTAVAHADEPAPSVAEGELSAALHCPRELRGVPRAAVLLVPGTNLEPRPNFDWNYEPALTRAGIPWCHVTLPRYATGDAQIAAEYVAHAVRRMRADSGRRVSVVGFSQGGVLPRWALKWWPGTRAMIEDVIGLSPSNHGTVAARPVCIRRCAASFRQQRDGSSFLTALNEGAETYAGIDYTVAYTRYDEIVTPNVDPATASSPLRTGAGRITNVMIQQICPANVSDHLALGSYDPVGWALALDALTHDGPADPARVDRGACLRPFMPGVDPARFPANLTRYGDALRMGFEVAEQVAAEPPLRCYVTATCASAAPARTGCAGRRVTLRLDRRLRSARVTVAGRPVRVRRRGGRLVVRADLRGRRARVVRVRIRGTTRSGRRVSQTRRLRVCAR